MKFLIQFKAKIATIGEKSIPEPNNPNKLNYVYVLTPKGIAEKTKLTINFMKRKMQEYDELKKELKQSHLQKL